MMKMIENMSSVQSHTLVRRRSSPPKEFRPKYCSNGFRFRSILLCSASLTVIGVILFRLATANTHNVADVKFFSIAGSILATAPWIVQTVVSSSIIVLYNAGVCDLTWLVRPSAVDPDRRSIVVSEDVMELSDHRKERRFDSVGEGNANDSCIVSVSEPSVQYVRQEH